MFGIGMPELIIIMVVALIVIGPEKLPGMARSIGKGLSAFKKAADDVKEDIMGAAEEPKAIPIMTDPSESEPKGASLKPEEEITEKGKGSGSETPGHEEAV